MQPRAAGQILQQLPSALIVTEAQRVKTFAETESGLRPVVQYRGMELNISKISKFIPARSTEIKYVQTIGPGARKIIKGGRNGTCYSC